MYNVAFLQHVMTYFGMENKWAYHFPLTSEWYGISEPKRKEIINAADLLINVSGTVKCIQDYRQVRRLAYIDSDPVFTQIKIARGQKDFKKMIDMHDVCFSFGEAFSENIPDTGHQWNPTRQPIVLSEWENSTPRRDVFTTIMNWTSHNDVIYNGQTYSQKDVEFKRFLELPSRVAPTVLEISVNLGKTRRTPYDLLKFKGWQVVAPEKVCPDLGSYRNYIKTSKAEWSVAKNGYILGQPGWFSCRSACYLAAGRPVVIQDTGFSSILPIGEGILPFRTMEEAANAIREVETNYEKHAKAARDIAEEYFDSDRVFTHLIETAIGL